MKRRLSMIGITVLAMAAMGMGANAMHVEFSGEPFSANAVLTGPDISPDNETINVLQTNAFDLLGTDENGAYLVFTNSRYYRVDGEALSGVLDALGVERAEALPSISAYQSLQRRMSGDEVTKLQQMLIDLEFMESGADGNFGGQSERAVSGFQRAMGLEETGVADPMLQMLMESVKAEPVIVDGKAAEPEASAVKDPFALISGKTEANLDAAADLGLTLDYDDIAGTGMISLGDPLPYEVSASSDLERRSFTLRFGLRVAPAEGDDESDGIAVTPVLEIVCAGVQRPIMREVLLKSGDERRAFPIETLDEGLDGLLALESARVPLDAEAVEMLANAADNGELKVRVSCRYGEYDIEFTGEALSNAARVGQAALRLND